MNSFVYCQIDENGYCVGTIQAGEELSHESLIKIDSYDESYIWRKYDILNQEWTDEYYIQEDIEEDIHHEEENVFDIINQRLDMQDIVLAELLLNSVK